MARRKKWNEDVPVGNMTGKSKEILIDRFDWTMLKHIIDASTLIQFANRSILPFSNMSLWKKRRWWIMSGGGKRRSKLVLQWRLMMRRKWSLQVESLQDTRQEMHVEKFIRHVNRCGKNDVKLMIDVIPAVIIDLHCSRKSWFSLPCFISNNSLSRATHLPSRIIYKNEENQRVHQHLHNDLKGEENYLHHR